MLEFYSVELREIQTRYMKNLREIIKKKNIKILYITPLRGIDVSEISSICKEANVLTITGVEEYLENGVSVILSLINNKLKIIINQPSAKTSVRNY